MLAPKNKNEKTMIMGLGLDNSDGHKRLTKGDNFLLAGGSEETHEKMTETTVKFNEIVSSKGKQLEELSKDEFHGYMNEASSKTS